MSTHHLSKTVSLESAQDLNKDDIEKHEYTRPAPFTIPRSITIQDDGVGPSRERELRRVNSIGLSGPRVDVGSRVIGEFRFVSHLPLIPIRLPTDALRTLSIHVTDSQQRPKEEQIKKDAVKELASLDWHLISKDEALQRLNVSPRSGLDSEQAKRRLATNGPNAVSPPPRNLLKKCV